VRFLLAPGPRCQPCGRQLLDVTCSRAHSTATIGMQIRACSSPRDFDPRRVPDAHQRRPAAPRADTASPPNSTWYHAETRYKEWACCLHFARVLLAPRFYEHNNLQSGGRTHARGMASILPCGFIAQQCSVLDSFSLTVLFIAKAKPRAAGEVMTLSPCDTEGL
jgi:hypothetical protein